ncbi:MAG TPA: hypothetical protein ENG33_06410, partial [Chloroflexi bacterium]|nr:hypothetical protein [Chloroflexota bacterium]
MEVLVMRWKRLAYGLALLFVIVSLAFLSPIAFAAPVKGASFAPTGGLSASQPQEGGEEETSPGHPEAVPPQGGVLPQGIKAGQYHLPFGISVKEGERENIARKPFVRLLGKGPQEGVVGEVTGVGPGYLSGCRGNRCCIEGLPQFRMRHIQSGREKEVCYIGVIDTEMYETDDTPGVFCINLEKELYIGDLFSASDDTTACEVTWLLQNMPPSQTLDHLEAAARQVAIWYFSDGYELVDDLGTGIAARAQEIINSVPQPCSLPQHAPDLSIEPANVTIFLPEATQTFTVTAYQDGHPLEGLNVSLSTDFGTLSDDSVVTGEDGKATFTLTNTQGEPGTAHIRASAVFSLPKGLIFNVLGQDRQDLVLGDTTEGSIGAEAQATWENGGSILAHKFNDLNMNGKQEDDEPNLSGWEISLYDDEHTLIKTKSTDANGNVVFQGLAPGDYIVEEELVPGWLNVTPISVTVTITQEGASVSFGNIKLPVVVAYKFNDLDRDGVKGDGEPFLDGWWMTLYRSDGSIYKHGGYTEDGKYVFSAVDLGDYYLAETPQNGWQNTTPISVSLSLEPNKVYEVYFGNDLVRRPSLELVPDDAQAPCGDGPYEFELTVRNTSDEEKDFARNVEVTFTAVKNGDYIERVEFSNGDVWLPGDEDEYVWNVGDIQAGGEESITYTVYMRAEWMQMPPESEVKLKAEVTREDNWPEHNEGIRAYATGARCEAQVMITGRVFEDVDGEGDAFEEGDAGKAGVDVVLLSEDGAAVLASTQTDAQGYYTFTVKAGGVFYVAVDSKDVSPAAGFWGGHSQEDVWAEQTYECEYIGGSQVCGSAFGGENPAQADDFEAGHYEHIARVELGPEEDATGVDFGFNFNLIVNTNDSGQGSLRQFILNANAIKGPNASIFRIPEELLTDIGNGAKVARIVPLSSLPALENDNTTLDATTQTSNIGDTNPGQVGTGGTVGVDGLTLPLYDKPEVVIDGNGLAGNGLDIENDGMVIRGFAIYGFGGNAIYMGRGGKALIEGNFIGVAPDGTRPAGANGLHGVFIGTGTKLVTVRNNYVGYNGFSGIRFYGSRNGLAEGNEVFENGWNYPHYGDGVTLTSGTSNTQVRGNLVYRNRAFGLDVFAGANNNIIENNTFRENGVYPREINGIAFYRGAEDNLVTKNIIAYNPGAGIAVSKYYGVAVHNTFTQNSFHDNGGIAIDLDFSDGFDGDGVSPNDGVSNDSTQPNYGLDFPVIETVSYNPDTGRTTIEGTAPANTVEGTLRVEVYKAKFSDNDMYEGVPYGEGEVFLGAVDGVEPGGIWSIEVEGLGEEDYVTAIVIDAEGNTSEFCASVRVGQPEIDVNASAEPEEVPSGEEVMFTYVVVNTGNIILHNVTITDSFENTFLVGDLGIGASATVTTSEVITESITNIVWSCGESTLGVVCDQDSVTVVAIPPTPTPTPTNTPTPTPTNTPTPTPTNTPTPTPTNTPTPTPPNTPTPTPTNTPTPTPTNTPTPTPTNTPTPT